MLKAIIIIVAGIAFAMYATSVFQETFAPAAAAPPPSFATHTV